MTHQVPGRRLGRSGLTISAMGLGCWTIGGAFWRDHHAFGWGEVDDDESARSVRTALDLGITFFDTSDVYGCGHSERVLGAAIAGRRGEVVLATKFGNVFDEATRRITGRDITPSGIQRSCEASLRRLGTEVIDLYQLHLAALDDSLIDDVVVALEDLVAAGKIIGYGWSTTDLEAASRFARGPHCHAIQHPFNIFQRQRDLIGLCEELDMAGVIRSPLAMGLLTGKYRPAAPPAFPATDVRGDWDFASDGRGQLLADLEAARAILTREGHTLAQAALAWIWSQSEVAIPIPGFRDVAQVRENIGALDKGPLSSAQIADLEVVFSGRQRGVS